MAAVIALAACVPEDQAPSPDWSWRGEHVTIHAYGYEPDDVCGGTFEETDAHVAQIADWHGVDASKLDVAIHWVADPRFADEEWCPSYAAGCVVDGEVRVPRLPFGHELSHAVDYASGLRDYAPVLEEGFAAIHSDPTHGGPPTPDDPVDRETDLPGNIRDALITPPTPPDRWFSVLTAGHFVTYLVETHGLDAIHELRARAGADIGQPGWDALFQDVLGQSFEQVLQGYEAFPLCSWNGLRPGTYALVFSQAGSYEITIEPA